MSFLTRFVSRIIGLTLLLGAAALTTALALVLIAVQLIGEDALIERAACEFGLSDTCIRQQLEESQQELQRQRRKGERLQERMADKEAVLDRLAGLEHAASSFVIFYEDRTGFGTVITGHRYASLLNPDTLRAGWCYIEITQGPTFSGSLYIARFDADLKLRNERVSRQDRSIADLSRKQVEEARTHCRWPQGLS